MTTENNEKPKEFKLPRKSYTLLLPINLINRISFIKKLKKGSIDIGEVFAKSLYPTIIKIEESMHIDKDTWKSSKKCPQCSSMLIIRNSSKGKFYGCYNYPNCKYVCKL